MYCGEVAEIIQPLLLMGIKTPISISALRACWQVPSLFGVRTVFPTYSPDRVRYGARIAASGVLGNGKLVNACLNKLPGDPMKAIAGLCKASVLSLLLHALHSGSSPSALPDPRRTPGAVNPAVTQANIDSTICVRGWTRTVRPPKEYTDHLKRQQIREYGYTDHHLSDFEEDHLIPLEIGGAPADPRNLWPEPHVAPGGWGSRRSGLNLDRPVHLLYDLGWARGRHLDNTCDHVCGDLRWLGEDKPAPRPGLASGFAVLTTR
jgi:hypothetical protein